MKLYIKANLLENGASKNMFQFLLEKPLKIDINEYVLQYMTPQRN